MLFYSPTAEVIVEQRLRGAFGGPMVRARNGQHRVYWPGVIQAALVIIGVSLASQMPVAVFLGGKYHLACIAHRVCRLFRGVEFRSQPGGDTIG